MIGTLGDRRIQAVRRTPGSCPLPIPPPSPAAERSLRGLLLLLATIAGVSVANIYYNQPLLDNFRRVVPA